MNWTIGQQYELVEKGGAIYELGTLVAIHINDTLTFKKQAGELHIYRIESNVSYRPIGITPLATLQDTPHTEQP